jgi:hypothetical protein
MLGGEHEESPSVGQEPTINPLGTEPLCNLF